MLSMNDFSYTQANVQYINVYNSSIPTHHCMNSQEKNFPEITQHNSNFCWYKTLQSFNLLESWQVSTTSWDQNSLIVREVCGKGIWIIIQRHNQNKSRPKTVNVEQTTVLYCQTNFKWLTIWIESVLQISLLMLELIKVVEEQQRYSPDLGSWIPVGHPVPLNFRLTTQHSAGGPV